MSEYRYRLTNVFLHEKKKKYLGSRIDGELQLGLLAIVNRQALHEERCESGSSSTTKGVEDEESLETCALVSQLSDAVQH